MSKKLFKNWFKSGLINELNLTIRALTSTINSLEDSLRKEKEKNIDNQNNMALILENSVESRRKIRELEERITDLENNIEFLVNNLSKTKKELVRPSNQN